MFTVMSDSAGGKSPVASPEARVSFTAWESIWANRSKPTADMLPDCSAPSMEPAPRISRSRMAMRMPLPRSWCSLMAVRRAAASSVRGTFSGNMK